ncbi:MAG: 5'-deoxynucleotidase [Clostridia bacterium]|nr:5'-deoxynucleotidase [Clostridia bacterium]
MKMYKFFAFLNRMKYIKRWSLMRSVREENIMEHSQQVSVIAHALSLINNKIYGKNVDVAKVVMLAQYHEVSEVITGDLPTPIKYFNPEIKSAYKDLEKNASERLINMLPDDLKEDYRQYILPDTDCEEYKIVKCADRLAAYLKCVEEVKAGNSEFKKAKTSIGNELKSLKRQDVEYYLKEFAPAFDLTLDELD